MKDWKTPISSVFFFLSLLIVGYMIFEIIKLPFSLGAGPKGSSKGKLDALLPTRVEAIETYQGEFASHAVFSKPKAPVVQKVITLSDLLKPYALTGVVQGGNPEAFIQNNTTKQTYLIQAGGSFDKFNVVEVRSHSVIIEYQGEQKELFIEEGFK